LASHSKDLDDFVAMQVRNSFSSASNVYLTFGKSSSWTNDSYPPAANTSVDAYNEVWNNMIGAKKIYTSDVRTAIPRVNWVYSTVYAAYDNATDSQALKNANSNFYILTSDYNVYKCLFNNNGSPSTIMPSATVTATHFQTTDGYVWKYMYTLNAEEQLRFLTTNFMPCRTISNADNSSQWVVQENATDGAIHVIQVTNNGTNYSANDVSVVITGDGNGANAFAIVNTVSKTVQSIVVDNLGSGYTFATASLLSSLGSGAAARPIISPPGGHGSDPESELGASYLVINAQFKNSENGTLTVHNDYRQIALVQDPITYGGTTPSSVPVVSQLTVLNLNGSSAEYIEDEWVYQGSSLYSSSFKGQVTEWDSPNNIIKLSQTQGIPTKDLLVGANTTASRFVGLVTNPGLQKRTGRLLYLDNLAPIQRAYDQTEDYKIVLNL
jgi:hypothetical protein